MKKIMLLAVSAALSATVQADFIAGDSPLVKANTYLDLADAGGRIVAVGDRGKILYSDDEGGHWQVASTPSEVLLTSVCFADARHGWAVGHDALVLGTSDGGETWTLQYSDPLGGDGTDDAGDIADGGDVAMDDLSMDDIYGDPYADEEYSDDPYGDDPYSDDPYADDAGSSSGPVDTSGAPLLDVQCESRDHAVAVGGYGYYLETTDGGASWSKKLDRLKNGDGWHLYDLTAVSKSATRYLVGEKGAMFRSVDEGASWERLKSPYSGTLFGALALSDAKALVYGLQGNIWLTGNRGVSWSKVPSGLSRGINDGAVLANGSLVLVTNAGGILTSDDEGKSFSLRFLPDRESISAVLPREKGGILIAGQGGVRVIEDVK
ncbi:YCF48-related protein [Alcanivorax sp. S6407]|uniref:WD40/YVTN/BNR-like repeat-containing protein n=1 Tax=Alcanivorax sp. S6407 TaxID=2926424 RepID=UPI001FF192E7|nr:YCF48-related protein [Alcanivorax sp. S6407]MCK0153903.1 YCF48-related protein [Alcanivorax sp. S6407]